MPELPEVETLKRSLEPLLTGRRILSLEMKRPEVIKHPDAENFAQGVAGQRIQSLGRRGKYLLLYLENGSRLLIHLRMTGRLVCCEEAAEELPHTHLCFHLENGQVLRFSDVRRFGGLWLLAAGEEDQYSGMKKLGPEPLEGGCCPERLETALSRRKICIKQGILDQSVLAGLGNIYADEALFRAGIRPDRPCSSLSRAEWEALSQAIPEILSAAIRNRGTSFSDYLDGEGRKGENQNCLQAYQRGGQTCLRCGAVMEKTRIGGRGTCFCPCCQK